MNGLSDSPPIEKRKRGYISTLDMEEKKLQRVLKNRQAANASREKKRKYTEMVEQQNQLLLEQNEMMNKRIKVLEDQNSELLLKIQELEKKVNNSADNDIVMELIKELGVSQPAVLSKSTSSRSLKRPQLQTGQISFLLSLFLMMLLWNGEAMPHFKALSIEGRRDLVSRLLINLRAFPLSTVSMKLKKPP